MWVWSRPSVQSVTPASGCPACTCCPTDTPLGSTWRKTHTRPSADWTLTVPPKIWPELPRDSRTSTIVPATGARTSAPGSVNMS